MPPSKRKAEDIQAQRKAEEHRKGRQVLEAERLKKERYAAAAKAAAATAATTAAASWDKARRKKAEEHRKGRLVLQAEQLKKARYTAANAATTKATTTTSSGGTCTAPPSLSLPLSPPLPSTTAKLQQRSVTAATSQPSRSRRTGSSQNNSSSSNSRSAHRITPTKHRTTAKQCAAPNVTVVEDLVRRKSTTNSNEKASIRQSSQRPAVTGRSSIASKSSRAAAVTATKPRTCRTSVQSLQSSVVVDYRYYDEDDEDDDNMQDDDEEMADDKHDVEMDVQGYDDDDDDDDDALSEKQEQVQPRKRRRISP
jgi:hypothetical protein